jgi:hypothetical protein
MSNVLLALAGLALAAPPPGTDHSSGAGHVLQTDFVGSGYSGPNGENPVGTLTLTGYLHFTATLTCGHAAGNAVVGGYRIETGERAGEGFISSSVDNGRPRHGHPVDVTVYSGYLRRPPVDCPAPGDPPPPGFRSTGGGPFISGDFTLVDAKEQLSPQTPAASVERMSVSLRPRRLSGHSDGALVARVRVCGLPGTALLRFSQTSSPVGQDRPTGVHTSWETQLRHDAGCETHLVSWRLASYPGGRRYRVGLRARTTGRRWSPPLVRRVDAL